MSRHPAHLYQLSPDLCLLSPLPVLSTWRRRGWECRRAPVGTCSPSLSLTHPGSERGSPWVNDQCLKQSLCSLPASNYQDKAVCNNGYCRIAYSPEDLIQTPMKSVERLPLISIDFTSDCQPAVGCFAVNCDTLFKTFSFKGRSQYHKLFTQSEEVPSFLE